MKSVINLFKKSLKYPAIWVGVVYLIWLFSVPIGESYFFGIILFLIYLTITILAELSSTKWKFALVLLVVLIPVAWVASNATIWLEVEWLNRNFIFTLLTILLASYPAISILRQPSNKDKLLAILMFIMTLPILTTNVMYVVTYFPKVIDKVEFGKSTYYIVSGIDQDEYRYRSFYKCKKWSLDCDIPYSTYFGQDFEKIIIDTENNEVSAISSEPNSRLVFTYANSPRIYYGHPVKLGEHIYQISVNFDSGYCAADSCDLYIYKLYECKLNYTSCIQLPIQYSTNYDSLIYLSANEITNEIMGTYSDNTLLFTYGRHSVCYADGCVILDQ